MPETKIRVPPEVKDKLDVTVTQLKKRKRGRVTHADAILSLYKTIKDLKKEKRDSQAKQVLAESTEKEVVAIGEGAETTKDLIEHPIRKPSEHTKCPYYTQSQEKEGVVNCRKDHFKKGTLYRIPENVCMKCWQQNKDILVPLEQDEKKKH